LIVNREQVSRLIGEDEAIRRVEAEADAAAPLDVAVLLIGEPGVGKQLVARRIHQRSRRACAALVSLNCAGLPDFLVESELFGHLRGSFPGAYRDKPGLLELAPDGTLFLDGLDHLSLPMQSRLVGLLESGEVQRVGAHRPHTRVNFRLIAASHQDPGEATAGTFRQDLNARLGTIRLFLPPLRERVADIPLLVDSFLESYRHLHQAASWEVAPEAMKALVAHRWPGNVRQLKHVVERAAQLARGRTIRRGDLPADVSGSGPLAAGSPARVTAAPTGASPDPPGPAYLMSSSGDGYRA